LVSGCTPTGFRPQKFAQISSTTRVEIIIIDADKMVIT
jgi:hypothetical protein